LRSFHPGITALTGTPAQIAAAAALFEAAFAKQPGPAAAFSDDHTIKIYLVDPERAVFGTLDLNTEPAARLGLLHRLLAKQERSG